MFLIPCLQAEWVPCCQAGAELGLVASLRVTVPGGVPLCRFLSSWTDGDHGHRHDPSVDRFYMLEVLCKYVLKIVSLQTPM